MFEQDEQKAITILHEFFLGITRLSGPEMVNLMAKTGISDFNCAGHFVEISEGEQEIEIVCLDDRLNRFES